MGEQVMALLLIFALVVLNGYFAAAEIALISARRAALKSEAAGGSEGARVALALTEDPSRMLAAVQIGITLVGFLASAIGAVSLARGLAGWLEGAGAPVPPGVLYSLSVVLVTLAVTYVTLVFGELAPKRLGLQRAEVVAKRVARPIALLARLAAPLTWLLSRSTDLVALLLGVKPGQGRPGISEEEIKLLVTEQGSLLDEEKRMIHEIFELGDTVAREIMVPRVDMRMIEDTATLRDAVGEFMATGLSRLPVFHEDPDEIKGVVLFRDLMEPAAAGELDVSVEGFVRPTLFVPETKLIIPLLAEMRDARLHLAIVVDEHGGTAGLLTIEDIVEEVVGEIADEFDRDRRLVTEAGRGVYYVDGRLPVQEAEEILGLRIPESEEYETLAGWVLMELGHIPLPGESVRAGRDEVTVQAMRRRRISRLRVRKGVD